MINKKDFLILKKLQEQIIIQMHLMMSCLRTQLIIHINKHNQDHTILLKKLGWIFTSSQLT